MDIFNRLLPVMGEPPVSFGSAQVKMADSWRMLTISGGAGASGTSGRSREIERVEGLEKKVGHGNTFKKPQ